MKVKHLLLVTTAAITLLSACDLMPRLGSSNAEIEVTVQGERQDTEVAFADDVQLLNLSDSEKATLYADYDAIEKYSAGTKSPIAYSQVTELDSDQAYTDFILSTQKEAKIIYLGFDECPYCKAFTPKLNQLAKELDLPVYYYNTRRRENDLNYQSAMATYNVQTVPHAFIMKNGKVQAKVNHLSSMSAIEAFVKKTAEMNQ